MTEMLQTVFPLQYRTIPQETKQLVLERDEYTCQNCKTKPSKDKLEVHHKIPVKKGGTHDMDNLIAFCKKCHKTIEPPRKLNYAYPTATTIRMRRSTIDLIDSLGKRGETYEEILLRLLTPLAKRRDE